MESNVCWLSVTNGFKFGVLDTKCRSFQFCKGVTNGFKFGVLDTFLSLRLILRIVTNGFKFGVLDTEISQAERNSYQWFQILVYWILCR